MMEYYWKTVQGSPVAKLDKQIGPVPDGYELRPDPLDRSRVAGQLFAIGSETCVAVAFIPPGQPGKRPGT